MSGHALLSPSSAHRWMRCPGAVAATLNVPDKGGAAAREGTAAHELAQRALDHDKDAEFFRGVELRVPYDDSNPLEAEVFVVGDEMIEQVQKYLDNVRREPGELLVEQRLPLDEVYAVEEQFGTGDAVILQAEQNTIRVHDLKYGRGVMVFAKDNEQLYSYGAAALMEHGLLFDEPDVTVVIDQPRLNHYDEHTLTYAELMEFIEHARERAAEAMALIGESDAAVTEAMQPGNKQCQWCPIKGSCAALAQWVNQSVYDDFEDLTVTPTCPKDPGSMSPEVLAEMWARQDTISGWVKAVQAEAKRQLEAGVALPGLKLVTGKKGNRAWADSEAVEQRLKTARVKRDDMYNFKLVSPAQAETAFKKSKPKVWKSLSNMITQSDGAPAVVPESDKRPALVVSADDQFEDITDDFADLL